MAACDFVLLRTVVVMTGGQRIAPELRGRFAQNCAAALTVRELRERPRQDYAQHIHDRAGDERHADERERVVACERAREERAVRKVALLQLVAAEDFVAQGPQHVEGCDCGARVEQIDVASGAQRYERNRRKIRDWHQHHPDHLDARQHTSYRLLLVRRHG